MKRIVALLIVSIINLSAQSIAESKYLSFFIEASKYYKIDIKLLIAIAKVESNLNHTAISKNSNGTYDRGIMQINDYWVNKYQKEMKYDLKTALLDPEYNIRVGAWILRDCINIHGKNWKAVDCYNKGASRAQDSSAYVFKVWKHYSETKDISLLENTQQNI